MQVPNVNMSLFLRGGSLVPPFSSACHSFHSFRHIPAPDTAQGRKVPFWMLIRCHTEQLTEMSKWKSSTYLAEKTDSWIFSSALLSLVSFLEAFDIQDLFARATLDAISQIAFAQVQYINECQFCCVLCFTCEIYSLMSSTVCNA